jgi:DUF1009 family protein
MKEKEKIGIIAGGGQFPFMVADSARNQGFSVTAVAFEGEADPALTDSVDKIVWVKLGQLGKLIKAFKKNNIKKALMAGTITKRKMFDKVRPDLRGLTFISKFAVFHDDNILRALADELAAEDIEIISSTSYLPEIIARKGCLTKRKPGKEEKTDIRIGWSIAKELGRLDIGQCVVIKRKTVLALEAIDGTNETILRGGKIAGKDAVVVKVSKPNQDMRFDVPTIGLETIKVMSRIHASTLAIEAGKTLIFDQTDMIELANKSGISVIAYEKDNFA